MTLLDSAFTILGTGFVQAIVSWLASWLVVRRLDKRMDRFEKSIRRKRRTK